MATRVKTDFKKAKKKVIKNMDLVLRELGPEYEKKIIQQLNKGISPVGNEGKFEEYSEDYADQIKRGKGDFVGKKVSPVNLKLTGELHDSVYHDVDDNVLTIGFDNELADIHNRLGAGKGKVKRRMLPTEPNEVFNRIIRNAIQRKLKAIIKKLF